MLQLILAAESTVAPAAEVAGADQDLDPGQVVGEERAGPALGPVGVAEPTAAEACGMPEKPRVAGGPVEAEDLVVLVVAGTEQEAALAPAEVEAAAQEQAWVSRMEVAVEAAQALAALALLVAVAPARAEEQAPAELAAVRTPGNG